MLYFRADNIGQFRSLGPNRDILSILEHSSKCITVFVTINFSLGSFVACPVLSVQPCYDVRELVNLKIAEFDRI